MSSPIAHMPVMQDRKIVAACRPNDGKEASRTFASSKEAFIQNIWDVTLCKHCKKLVAQGKYRIQD